APSSFPIADTKRLHGRPRTGDDARVSELPRRDDEDGKRAAGALIKRLEVRWPRGAPRLTVLFLPDCDVDDQVLLVAPLNHWLARHPIHRSRRPQPVYRTKGLCDPEQSALYESPALDTGSSGNYSRMRINHV